jgi:hypothetical protein
MGRSRAVMLPRLANASMVLRFSASDAIRERRGQSRHEIGLQRLLRHQSGPRPVTEPAQEYVGIFADQCVRPRSFQNLRRKRAVPSCRRQQQNAILDVVFPTVHRRW